MANTIVLFSTRQQANVFFQECFSAVTLLPLWNMVTALNMAGCVRFINALSITY